MRNIPVKVGYLKIVEFAGEAFANCKIVSSEREFEPGMRLKSLVESRVEVKKRKKRNNAVIASLLTPGRGQIIYKQHRGWLYLGGVLGSAGLAVYGNMQYNAAKEDYDDALIRYNTTGDPEVHIELLAALDDMDSWRDIPMIMFSAAGGIWAWSVIDAVLWGGSKKKKEFTHSGTNNPQFSLVARPRQVGIAVRF
ncbi:MAG: DUF5683 domain-containing protein [Candidatus Hatepunaea meridiana]|nr:DUF5683 domain-containing protein [Candidatus Hatepunaea meridiana]